MRKTRRPWLRIPPLALAAAGALVAASAATASPPVRISGVDTGGYPDLRVTVVAPSGSAQPTLAENGVPVAGLEGYNLGKAKSVALLIDRSQSMAGRPLRDAVAAARAFVAGKGAADRVEVIAFGHQALALTRFSSSTADADAALRDLRPDRTAGTALWDAVALASRKLDAENQPGHVIIVLTDGKDVSSTTTFGRAVNAAHRANASIYPIGVAGPAYTPAPLRDLAERTGGSYHEASSTAQLAAIYASIGNVLSRTWELRYPTAARPGESLRLKARIAGLGSSTVPVELAGLGSSTITPPPSSVLPGGIWASPFCPSSSR